MQALILAGGEGTRLRPLTISMPKPIVPIGNQPFLLRQIELLKSAGITDIILSLNYQPLAIEKSLGDGSAFGVNLRYLIEPTPLGTGGAYKFAEKFLKHPTIVLNGDILTDIDLRKVIKQHRKNHSLATIVLTEVENPSAYGLVKIGENSEVLNFLEKPKADKLENINTINAGIYIFEPRVLNIIPKGERYSFEYQLFPELLRLKEKFHGYVARGDYWLDIGTPERYWQAHCDLMAGKIKNIRLNQKDDFNSSQTADIDAKSIIGYGCVIGSGAKIINSTLGENVFIGENTSIIDSVIWKETKIDIRSQINNSIVGNNTQIGKNVILKKGGCLGENTNLSDFTIC